MDNTQELFVAEETVMQDPAQNKQSSNFPANLQILEEDQFPLRPFLPLFP